MGNVRLSFFPANRSLLLMLNALPPVRKIKYPFNVRCEWMERVTRPRQTFTDQKDKLYLTGINASINSSFQYTLRDFFSSSFTRKIVTQYARQFSFFHVKMIDRSYLSLFFQPLPLSARRTARVTEEIARKKHVS